MLGWSTLEFPLDAAVRRESASDLLQEHGFVIQRESPAETEFYRQGTQLTSSGANLPLRAYLRDGPAGLVLRLRYGTFVLFDTGDLRRLGESLVHGVNASTAIVATTAEPTEFSNNPYHKAPQTATPIPVPYQTNPDVPWWAWIFACACGVLLLGGCLPAAVGIAGASACISVAKDTEKRSVGLRVAICAMITIGVWLFIPAIVLVVLHFQR